MNDSERVRVRSYRFERYAWALIVMWTVVVAASLGWNVVQIKHHTLEAARIQARSAYEKDIIYRRWNTGHGGVYVPVTEISQPNPYLSDMPERDITTASGKLLTLMNPAYMTRQVHELAEKEYNVHGHITSLNPIRAENAPDPWETEALQAFELGETEISSLEKMKGEEYMRLMRPLFTERGCLKCHAVQGYREGDIRGGISVSIPMEPLKAIVRMNLLTMAGGHILFWLLGLGGIVLGTQRLMRSERERRLTEEALRDSEKRYRGLYESSKDGIASCDLDGKFLECNLAYAEMLGYTKEELYNLGFRDIAPRKWDDLDAKLFTEQMIPRGYSDEYEKEYIKKDGTIFPVSLKGWFIEDKEGNRTGTWAIVRDITERKKAEEQLMKSQEDLRNLAAHLQSVREDERKSVAREIHDDVGQNLAALKMDMYMLEKKLPREQKPLIDRMKTMVELTDSTVQTVRRIHEELRPTLLDGLGFVESIKSYKKEFEDKTEIKCELHIEPESIDLSEERSLAFFRILQESMTNVRLHAGATKVNVSIKEKNGKLELKVKDNGIGIKEEQLLKSDSFGLIGIRERVDFLGGEVSAPSKAYLIQLVTL